MNAAIKAVKIGSMSTMSSTWKIFSLKISSHSQDTSQLIFKTNQLAGFCMDDKVFIQR